MPKSRLCIDCPAIGPWTRGRCPTHERARDQARGTPTDRGYGTAHRATRAQYQQRMDAGKVYYCWRPTCGEPIDPTSWHLGHDDHDRSVYRGPECASCNLSNAGSKSARNRTA